MYYLCYPVICFASCDGITGLYEKKMELRRKHEDIEKDYFKDKEKANMYEKQIANIDLKYRNVIYDILYEYERGENKLFYKCCDIARKDKYLFFVCKLIEYKHLANSETFLSGIPNDKDGLYPFWEIDSITAGPFGYPKPHPKLFDTSSFVNAFLNEIYQLAANGNEKAIDVFLKVQIFADGEYGEYMEDKVLCLFEKHSAIVIKNWELIKKYKTSIGFESTDYHVKADDIINNYLTLCKKNNVDSVICNEIIEFLDLNKHKSVKERENKEKENSDSNY